MTNYYYSFNGEEFYGPCPSRSEALQSAVVVAPDHDAVGYDGTVKVFTGKEAPPDLDYIAEKAVPHELVLDNIEDHLGDEVGEAAEGAIERTQQAQDDLDTYLRRAVRVWLSKYPPSCAKVVEVEQHYTYAGVPDG